MLGIFWNVKTDKLMVDFKAITVMEQVTLRSALKQVGSLYDPLGLASPVVLPFKAITQRIQKESKNNLDATVSKTVNNTFWKTVRSLQNVAQLQVPRCIGVVGRGMTLAIFCDASEIGLGAVAYAIETISKKVTLLASKSALVPPTKKRIIHEIELQAAVVGVTLLNKIKAATGIQIIH